MLKLKKLAESDVSGVVSRRSIWRLPYSHADFDQANNLINATDWTFLDDETDMDTLWSMWEKRFMTIMKECIPKATISP